MIFYPKDLYSMYHVASSWEMQGISSVHLLSLYMALFSGMVWIYKFLLKVPEHVIVEAAVVQIIH
jgi:hypothetical protein